MAVNPRENLKNEHLLAVGMSGSGKTFFIRKYPPVTRKGAKIVIWDAYETHSGHFYKSVSEFGRGLAQALRSGKGFKLGLAVDPTPKNFEKFCAMVWAVANGRRKIVVIVGELADVAGSGRPTPNWGKLARVGRKYGVILLVETQRPQDIDKTIFTQTARKWVGYLESYDHAYIEKNIGLERGDMGKIKFESYDCFFKSSGNIRLYKKGQKVKL